MEEFFEKLVSRGESHNLSDKQGMIDIDDDDDDEDGTTAKPQVQSKGMQSNDNYVSLPRWWS